MPTRSTATATATDAAAAAALVVALSGCGRGGAGAATPAGLPAPIDVVEPTCIAEHPAHASAEDLVSSASASAVVRVAATGPSQDHRSYPLPPMSQLNDSQAAWQVASDGSLVPVDPDHDLGVTSTSQPDVGPAAS